ncbi:hypothetical protein PLESTB_001223400 [Pleodorina starrii]|uniref:Uncharacterized protein n=1 Tax=Pleodorina starrii TaxID=330485 RepID=A0A9W6BSI4_9CHLO|nr:hypothetical protein PLESTB_001223400 [Pleodorina starrii]
MLIQCSDRIGPSLQKLYFTTLKAPTVNQTAAFIPIEEHHDTSSDIGACYFNFLFKFNSTMGALADAHAAQLYGQWPVDYIAWQWRFLGSDGYYNSPIYMSELAATHACAERVAASMEIDIRQRPMVLITDSWLFRNLVQMDTFAELVVPDMTFPHAARGRGAAVQAMQEDFVKLYLVSRARCLLTSGAASGLPLWLRGAGGDGGRSSGNNSAPFAIAASTAGSAAGGPTTPLKRLLEDQQPLASCRYDMATCEPLL